MSEFSVPLVQIEQVNDHPNADRLDIIPVFGYQCISQKGNFKPGDKAFYIPEDSIVPQKILEDLGMVGMLNGKDKNRVKTVRLRGEISQGILYPLDMSGLENQLLSIPEGEDTDYSKILNIEKYVPPIPAQFNGVLNSKHRGRLLAFDVNDFKRIGHREFKDEDITIDITEKLHGTFVEYVYCMEEDRLLVSSKGLAKQGIDIEFSDVNSSNLYVKTAIKYEIEDMLREIADNKPELAAIIEIDTVILTGEIVGPGVQDLTYGLKEPELFVFGLYARSTKTDYFIEFSPVFVQVFIQKYGRNGLTTVPWIGNMPLNEFKKVKDAILEAPSAIGGGIREGVVISADTEPKEGSKENVQKRAKLVSEQYLLRKGKTTEYN